MKSESFEVDLADFNSSHVLERVKIVGTAHLLLTILAFFLSLVLPWACGDMRWVYPMQLIAFLMFLPICFISVLLLIGAAKRRPSYLMSFIVVSCIDVFLVFGTGILAICMLWDVVEYYGLLILGVMIACAGLEAYSCILVCRAWSHLNALNTVKPPVQPTVLHLANIVGIIHLVITCVCFYLCFIIPSAVKEYENLTQPLYLVALLFAFIAAIIVCMLVGVSQRRASYLLPLFAVCFASFFLLLLWLITTVFTVSTMSRNDPPWLFLALSAIPILVELWSSVILSYAYDYLSSLKTTADQPLIIQGYFVPQEAIQSIY